MIRPRDRRTAVPCHHAGMAQAVPVATITLLALACIALDSRPARAQRPDTVLTGVRRPLAATPRDTTRPSPPPDTTAPRPLVTWADSDSVAQALLARPGYRATRYQGERVRFDALRRTLRIVGTPAAVGREQTLVIGDTVIYDDSTRVVTALGDTVILHDPSQQAADVVARGRVSYDIRTGRGTATNVETSLTSGNEYFVRGAQTAFVRDTSAARRSAFYVRNGMITSCNDSIPDYYFKSGEIKYVSRNLIVARPATLYVAGVPVFWLPFLFQDVRHGRRSGFLTPRFGLSEFVRNAPTYRRHIENLGYYVNMGDYMDASVWLDWRSGARGTVYDPGFTKYNGEFRYRWLDRFMNGGLAASRDEQRNGTTNTAVSWYHSQDFSQTSHLALNVNFVTNTTVQRQNTFNPIAQLSTIRSDANYTRKMGPLSLALGGSRSQYPGRSQVDEAYPNVSITSTTIPITSWLDWTPSFTYQPRATRNSDQLGQVSYRYFTNAAGTLDSARVKASTRSDALAFQTPFNIRGFLLNLGFTASSNKNDYPLARTFRDPADTSRRVTRTYPRSYVQTLDWNFSFSLPSLLPTTFRIAPSVVFQNADGGPYWVRSELSDARWVHQTKRPSFGISSTPTLFGLFRGFGPFSRIRHSITPSVRIAYSPRANVSPEYLRAFNRDPATYLGNLPQEQLSFGLTQVFEAKLRSDTSASGDGRKIKLLALNFTDLTWDFERARRTHRTGLTTNSWGYNATSDLLPGFTFNSSYSLFQGDIQSDTARFSPFLTHIGATFSLNGQSRIFGAIGRLFGRPTPTSPPEVADVARGTGESGLGRLSSYPVAGSSRRDRQYEIPSMPGGFSSNITFSLERQRPPRGGRVVAYDPAAYCTAYSANPAVFDLCQQQAILNPQIANPSTDPIAGGVFVRVPPREMISATNAMQLTTHWSANWSTQYDVVNNRFASNVVTLQRDLHDWRAVFSFSQSPNGNFYFSFFIANKAQPDLKFNYDKPTYRQTGGSP